MILLVGVQTLNVLVVVVILAMTGTDVVYRSQGVVSWHHSIIV